MTRRVPLLVALVAAAYYAGFVSYGINLEDEGTLLHQIARTFHGELPYIDFETGYTRGVFYLNAALFRLFGQSTLPLRVLLAGVNAATAGLICALAEPLAGGLLAAAAGIGYAASLPFFIGEFAAFNIPYPAWYAGLAWLATQAAMDRHLAGGGRVALFVAGLLAGIAFDFKPNSGVLAVLACGIIVALLAAGDGDGDRAWARALLVLAGLALVVMLTGALVALVTFENMQIAFPVIAGAPLALIVGRLVWARAAVARPERLWPAVTLLAIGAAIPTVPWLSYVFVRLGLRGFLRDVLLLGSGADRIYATSYPVPRGFPDSWGLIAAAALLTLAVVGLAAERGRLRFGRAAVWMAAAGLVVAWLFQRRARMPEGVLRSITWQVQQLGFFTVPPLFLVSVAVLLRRLRDRRARMGARGVRLLGMVVFALCMYVQIYPRIDSMHLLVALPSALILGTVAAARLARAWGSCLAVRPGGVRMAIAAAAFAVAAITAVPNYAALLTVGPHGPSPRAQRQLATAAAPVHVEAERSDELAALNDVLAHLRAHLAPTDHVFGFPALALVPYALGLPSPLRVDYFFPGRPDHRAEVEAVRRLAEVRPAYVLTLNRRLGFFIDSPAYFFILREDLARRYVLEARFGRYDILRRRDDDRPQTPLRQADAPADVTDRAAWFARLADPDRELRRQAARAFLARARDAAGVAPLAAAWAPTPPEQLLLMRTLGEFGDMRAVPYLADVFDTGDVRASADAAAALDFLGVREEADRYLLAGGREPVTVERPLLAVERLRGWMATQKRRNEVGTFAARALAAAHDTGAVPLLETQLREARQLGLRVALAEALVRLGRPEHVADLVELLGLQRHEVQDALPSFLIETAARYPAEVAAALARGMRSPLPLARETCAWIAGGARAKAAGAMLRATLADPQPGVRLAAAWALGRLGDSDAGPDLARLEADADPAVREFAHEALARLRGGEGLS